MAACCGLETAASGRWLHSSMHRGLRTICLCSIHCSRYRVNYRAGGGGCCVWQLTWLHLGRSSRNQANCRLVWLGLLIFYRLHVG